MEWVTELLGIGASAASGGVLGLVGAVVGKVGQVFQERQERKSRALDYAHEIKLLEMQHAQASREDLHEVEVMETQGSYVGLESSINAEATIQNVSTWVNNLRSLTRPVLTFSLIGIVAWMFIVLMDAIQTGTNNALVDLLGQTAVVEILTYIIYSVVFSACTAVVWWFGDRALTPPGMRSR